MLDSSKLKQFADDNFRFKGNGRKFAKCVENNVGKGEAIYPFPTLFSKDLHCRHLRTRACLGKGLNILKTVSMDLDQSSDFKVQYSKPAESFNYRPRSVS